MASRSDRKAINIAPTLSIRGIESEAPVAAAEMIESGNEHKQRGSDRMGSMSGRAEAITCHQHI
jgi:hypothetical protein